MSIQPTTSAADVAHRVEVGPGGVSMRELMRWFTPSSMTDANQARLQLVRAHEGFLYALANLGDVEAAEPAALRVATWNPYTTLAFEIMDTVRKNHLTLAPEIVVYLRMLVMLGTLRHQLATDYDLPAVARRFFGRLLQQKSEAWLDPQLLMGRVYGHVIPHADGPLGLEVVGYLRHTEADGSR